MIYSEALTLTIQGNKAGPAGVITTFRSLTTNKDRTLKMADTDSTNRAQQHRNIAITLLSCIASVAMDVRGLSMFPEEDDIHMSAAMLSSIVGMVERIGWMADLAAVELGGDASYSHHAADWMMPPAYHTAGKGLEVSHG